MSGLWVVSIGTVPATPLDRFVEQLDKGRPFAVIGKPCDISGVHNMRKLDPRVDELVKYTLAFSCGTFGDLQCSRWMLERVGFPGLQEGEKKSLVVPLSRLRVPWTNPCG